MEEKNNCADSERKTELSAVKKKRVGNKKELEEEATTVEELDLPMDHCLARRGAGGASESTQQPSTA